MKNETFYSLRWITQRQNLSQPGKNMNDKKWNDKLRYITKLPSTSEKAASVTPIKRVRPLGSLSIVREYFVYDMIYIIASSSQLIPPYDDH